MDLVAKICIKKVLLLPYVGAGETREQAIILAQSMRGIVGGKIPVSSAAALAIIDQAEHLRTHPQTIPDDYVLINWFTHSPDDSLYDIVTRAFEGTATIKSLRSETT